MSDGTINQSATHTGLTDRLRTFYKKLPSPLLIIGVGAVVGITAFNKYQEYREWELSTRFNSVLEIALQQHGDKNGDGIVSRAERDEFQIKFAQRYGLRYVSGYQFRYKDGRDVPAEDVIKMLKEYISKPQTQ